MRLLVARLGQRLERLRSTPHGIAILGRRRQAKSLSPLWAASLSAPFILYQPFTNDKCHPGLRSPVLDQSLVSGWSSAASLRDVPSLLSDALYDIHAKTITAIQARMQSEGGNATIKITAANAAVYLMWKVVPSGFMVRHFANSLESIRKARVWTSFTSNFSHMSMFHLVANMYLLNRFGYDVANILGSERFYLFYSAAGIASSLASLTFRRITKSNVLSLGASGAVVATLWLYACFFPDRRMSILGSERTVTMQELVLAYTVIDAAGLLGSLGKIDFAAHLGGAAFGNFWFYLVRDKLVEEHITRRSGEHRTVFGSFSRISGRAQEGASDEK